MYNMYVCEERLQTVKKGKAIFSEHVIMNLYVGSIRYVHIAVSYTYITNFLTILLNHTNNYYYKLNMYNKIDSK